MFLISATVSMLCHFAIFSLLERTIKSNWAMANLGFRPEDVALRSPGLLFELIRAVSAAIAIMFVLLSSTGIISFQTFLGCQTWVVGYLAYHIFIQMLYPEIIDDGGKTLPVVMIPISYIYSYGIYSWVYMFTFLLGGIRIYEFFSKFFQNRYCARPNSFRRLELGTIAFLFLFSVFTASLFPTIFFAGLFGIYFDLV